MEYTGTYLVFLSYCMVSVRDLSIYNLKLQGPVQIVVGGLLSSVKNVSLS